MNVGIQGERTGEVRAARERRREDRRPARPAIAPDRDRTRPPAPPPAAAIGSGTGSISSVNGMARFCCSVDPSSSTARGETMPNRSSRSSHASPSGMSAVRWPKTRISPASGTDAPVTRLTSSSPAPASMPPTVTRSPAAIVSSAMRSGRSAAVVLADAAHLEHGGAGVHDHAASASSRANSSAGSTTPPSRHARWTPSP